MKAVLLMSAVCALASVTIPSDCASAQAPGEVVSELPAPSGAHAVGTTTAYLRDGNRRDVKFADGRPVTVQLWYPAARATTMPAPYLFEPGLPAALQRYQYYGVDSAAIHRWAQLPTHAFVDAPPLAGTHPLLVFSVGLGVIRANYTSIAEELASHGNIVALLDSPLQGLMVDANGQTIADTIGVTGEPAGHLAAVNEWAGDISFALDRLLAGGGPTPFAAVAQHVDTARIGALGHSTGGVVAIQACERDDRIRACVNMDGGVASPDQQPMAEFVKHGITETVLFVRSQPLYDDSTFARRGITREEWVARGEPGRAAFQALVARSRAPIPVVEVAGTGHFSFSDAPFVMPSAITRFGGRTIARERGLQVITAVLRSFFDQELGGRGDPLGVVAARFPELTLTTPARQ